MGVVASHQILSSVMSGHAMCQAQALFQCVRQPLQVQSYPVKVGALAVVHSDCLTSKHHLLPCFSSGMRS